ncbi:substrate-binding periplasmic protein [Leeia oryzae]|uniref:substrate-binding periplasmic protein n=1 Tax=Leeia oryzae TaxID=356662 RepID=UPI00037BE2F0|nr:transporter substrate-binding domain-containing protein [Leeia oryzae]
MKPWLTLIRLALLPLASLLFMRLASGATLQACYDMWPPYIYTDEQQQTHGITADIMTEAARANGYDIRFTYRAYGACRKLVREGGMDMKLFSSGGEDADLAPLHVSTESWVLAAVVRQDSPHVSYTGIDMFKRDNIGLVTDYAYPDTMNVLKGQNPDYADVIDTSIDRLIKKRIDVAFDDSVWLFDTIRQQHLPLKVLMPAIAIEPQFTILAKRHKALAAKLDHTLAKMLKSGRIDAIYQKYTGKTFQAWREQFSTPPH